MSAFNPFRARAADGAGATNAAPVTVPDFPESTFLPPEQPSTKPPTQAPEPAAPQLSSAYPGKPALPAEAEQDDSTSSEDQTADPFNPESAASDEDDADEEPADSGTSRAPLSRSGDSSGSAPHQAPSTDRASVTSPSASSLPREYNAQTTPDSNSSETQTNPQSINRRSQISPEYNSPANAANRAGREKKPPPPPKSHHGKRISLTPNAGSIPEPPPSRSSKRLSYNSLSAENAASRPSGASNANPVAQSSGEDSSGISENPIAAESSESLARTRSQQRRPPTPPLSRRQSQMRRSKSTQSKSSTSRLTISSVDSESNDESQPPSPGPSTRSVGSFSQDRKRISMPPPSSGDTRPSVSSSGTPDQLSPSQSGASPNRRASSYGSLTPGSSSMAPPPPPPRRTRDSMIRSSDSASAAQSYPEPEATQPSNAQDILADLTRLQKEVDDLRGHYEGRKVSQ